jgi:hypothetical protein
MLLSHLFGLSVSSRVLRLHRARAHTDPKRTQLKKHVRVCSLMRWKLDGVETVIRKRKYMRNKHSGKCGLVVDEPAGSRPLIARAAGRAANPAIIHSIP